MNEIGCKTGVDMRAAMLLGELLASLNAHQLDLLAETLDRLHPLHPNPASPPDPDEMEPGERRRRKEKLTFAMCGIPIGSTLEFDDPRGEGYRADVVATVTTVDERKRPIRQPGVEPVGGRQTSIRQGGKYFTYRGEYLTDIRTRKDKECISN